MTSEPGGGNECFVDFDAGQVVPISVPEVIGVRAHPTLSPDGKRVAAIDGKGNLTLQNSGLPIRDSEE
jgi:hypothetical protein